MSAPLARSGDRPLAGRIVLVTRAREDAGPLAERLEGLGAQVLLLPALEIVPVDDDPQLDAVFRKLDRYDWIAFTSRNAVRAVFDRLTHLRLRFPFEPRIAAVGPSTAEELKARGVAVSCVPKEATAASLAGAMKSVAGQTVLLPQGDRARPDARSGLESAGAHVHDVVVYRTILPSDADPEALSALASGGVDVIALASPSAFTSLAQLTSLETLKRVSLACIGPTTAAAVRAAGIEPAAVATDHSLDGLVGAVKSVLMEESQ